MILRLPSLFLAAILAASGAHAQTAPSDPSKKNPPAEIVPPKPEMRPPSGQKAVEPASPSALSPGTQAAAPPPPALPAIVTELPVADLEKILTLLRQRYVSPSALAEPELKRATVQGLLERLGGGATLIATPAGPPEPSPFRSEIIDTRAGYVRLGTIDKETLAALDTALDGFTAKQLGACILDLRATPAGTDFELAAEVCRRFCPKGQLLFSVPRPAPAEEQIYTSKSDPHFRGLLLVLIDSDAAGSAEIIAGTLRPLAKAIVIGQRTKGEAAEYAEESLTGGHTLRYAVAEPKLPGSGSILPGGLEPDLPVQTPPETLAAVLRQELEKGVVPLLTEPERPRMNEAALVAGTNPELDALQANQRLRGERTKPILRDEILLRALDVVASISALKKP